MRPESRSPRKKLVHPWADIVPISDPSNYNEVNLYLAEIIDSTIEQFKSLIEKARTFTEVMTSQSMTEYFPVEKKNKLYSWKNHTGKKVTTLIMTDTILSQKREEKLCKKGTISFAIPLINNNSDIGLHMGTNNVPYCTTETMVDQILRLSIFFFCRKSQLVRLLFILQR